MNTHKSIAGNGLLVGLMIVAIIGAAVVGLVLYNKKGPMDSLPDAAAITTDAAPAEQPATNTDGEAVPFTAEETPATTTEDTAAATPTTTESAPVSAEAVALDVDKIFAPRIIGSADAPIKIVEYASLTCSHCAHFHNDVLPELKTKYIDTGKVQLEFREFPLNDPALKGALAARCLPEDKYESFVTLLFKTQENWAGGLDYTAALKQNAKLAGMSDATFEACLSNPELKDRMAKLMQEGQDKWKINATPTFVINDGAEIISGAQPLAEFERVFRKVSGDAVGEAPAVE
jgi:protein-disulfide isomerase